MPALAKEINRAAYTFDGQQLVPTCCSSSLAANLVPHVALLDALAQRSRRLEMGNALLRNFNGLTRAGISPHARRPLTHDEAAEPADFHATALGQRFRHALQDCGDRSFGVLNCEEVEAFRQLSNKVRTIHTLI